MQTHSHVADLIELCYSQGNNCSQIHMTNGNDDVPGGFASIQNEESVHQVEPKAGLYDRLFAGKSGAWTAVFTFFLVIFSALLWQVSKNANETSQVTERAFLSFGGPFASKVIEKKELKGINFTYTLGNSGTTPTKAGVTQINIQLSSIVPSRSLDFESLPQAEKTVFVLAPKGGIQMRPVFVSTADLEAVQEGKKHLFFWGYTLYHDIFPGTPARLTEFCTEMDAVAWTLDNHSDPTGDLNFVNPPCPTHNCYDEQCEDYSVRTK